MSHVTFSKLISVNYPKLYPKPPLQPTLEEVLQSEPVKRLLNQPNIIIETIPSACVTQSFDSINDVISGMESNKRKNNTIKEIQGKKIRPEISIMPVESENKEESRLLPSKGDGKSEIALVVVKCERKKCGHKEPCENIICDVSVEQYIDQSGVLPMLAVEIEEDEINAPVSKHCKNSLCDALSIEHNRCRRALIKIYRCDETNVCDICNISFKTRRAKMSHKKCTRKEVYRHNETNGAQILREKMRERELEMIEAAKTKKKEYLDPATEYRKYMEMLKNNKELIVIPKSVQQPQPIITITTVSSNGQLNALNNQDNSRESLSKFLPSFPLVFPQQSIVVGKRSAGGFDNNDGTSAKQPKISNVFCSGLTMATVPSIQSNSGQQQQFIKVTSVSQPNFVKPITLNDWLVSQANIVGSDKPRNIKPCPYLTPIRVVPITSLKSAPSLRHQTHGIPAFCLVPDNLPKTTNSGPKLQTIKPAPPPSQSPTPATTWPENETDLEAPGIKATPTRGHRKDRSQGRRKSEEKNSKNFKCPYCLKGFSTDWYFKMHVAGHTGEVLFSCKTCEKPFSNRYDMKKHMLNDHNDGECRCEICGQISICKSALEIHIRSHTGERPFKCNECDTSYRSSTDLKTHQRKRHDFIDCPYCNSHFVKTDLKAHLISSHMLTEDEALHEISENQNQTSNGNESSDNLDMEIDISDCESKSNAILMRIKEELMNEEANGTDKVQGDSIFPDNSKKNKNKKKRKRTKNNGNKNRVSKPREKDGKKNLESSKNTSPVLKQVANNSKEIETKPAVRRSSRRSNSNVQCTVCKDHFESTSLLENHLADNSKDTVECKECKSLFHSQIEYKKHNIDCGKSSCKQSCE